MVTVASITELPGVPAVYALYGGRGTGLYVAYAGIAGTSLRGRIEQHLVRRDSSVVTGVSAAHLNPDVVTQVWWWEHERFAERGALQAAELVAFDVLEPALRSRGGVTAAARALYEDAEFVSQMQTLFKGSPSGRLILPTLAEALTRIAALEARVAALEERLGPGGSG